MQSYLVTTVFPLSGRTYITIYGLDSGGRQRVCHTYVRRDRTAGEKCQQVTPLGVASGAPGELLCSIMASFSACLGGRGGDWGAGGPGGHGRLSGGCGNGSSGRWSGCSVDSGGGNCGGSSCACVGGGCGGEGEGS